MGLIFGSPQSEKEYYEDEARELRRRADRVSREMGDRAEAKRLRDLAKEAERQARSLEQQINETYE